MTYPRAVSSGETNKKKDNGYFLVKNAKKVQEKIQKIS